MRKENNALQYLLKIKYLSLVLKMNLAYMKNTFLPVLKLVQNNSLLYLLPCKLTCSMCQNSNVLHKYLKYAITAVRRQYLSLSQLCIFINSNSNRLKFSNIYVTCLLQIFHLQLKEFFTELNVWPSQNTSRYPHPNTYLLMLLMLNKNTMYWPNLRKTGIF